MNATATLTHPFSGLEPVMERSMERSGSFTLPPRSRRAPRPQPRPENRPPATGMPRAGEREDPSQYLYGAQGPWPRPSSVMPEDMPPTALLLPDREIADFRAKVVKRYLRQVRRGWPGALVYALRHVGLEPVADGELSRLLTATLYSRFLNPHLDPGDETTFAAVLGLHRDANEIFKIDFSAMALLEPLPGIHFAPTVTLLRRDRDGRLIVLATAFEGVVLRPGDGDAWELAKYFVLQGAAIHVIECIHPRIHFPMNAVNALAKSLLPKSHLLLQLLLPHLELQLPLDCAALYRPEAVARNDQRHIHTPFPDKNEAVYPLTAAGYRGLPGNSSYPAYRFQAGPDAIHSDYGVFLARYYRTILDFVDAVVAKIPAPDPHVARWADACRRYVPGFPDAGRIFRPGVLARTVAALIANYSVNHTTDHFNYSGESLNKVPLRLRVPAPRSTEIAPLDRRRLVWRRDVFRHKLAHEMFFKPTVLTHLKDVDYRFRDPGLRQRNGEFRDALTATDRTMPVERFAPLDQIAASIQF